MLYGGVSQENIDIMVPIFDTDGNEIPQFNSLGDQPYVELGYGVENIFKVIQINFIHRVTEVTNDNSRKFGIKIGFQFTL